MSFEPRRAGLPDVSIADGTAYLDKHHRERPWLSVARDRQPEVQRVFAALDQGGGHAHIRHEGWVTEEMNERRVRNLEDPAQLDPQASGRCQRCRRSATSLIDAAVSLRGSRTRRPSRQPSLAASSIQTYGPHWIRSGPVARPVSLLISDVLGDDGHKFCSGWRLEPVNGSMLEALANRATWVAGNHDVPEPSIRPVETFEGGTVTYVFRAAAGRRPRNRAQCMWTRPMNRRCRGRVTG